MKKSALHMLGVSSPMNQNKEKEEIKPWNEGKPHIIGSSVNIPGRKEMAAWAALGAASLSSLGFMGVMEAKRLWDLKKEKKEKKMKKIVGNTSGFQGV